MKTDAIPMQTIYPDIGLLIDGQWIRDRPPLTDIVNPSTGETLGQVPAATSEDIAAALRSTEKGFQTWQRVPLAERVRILMAAVGLMAKRKEELATILTLEQGKPYADALSEVERACGFLEWDAQQALRTYGSVLPSDASMRRMVLKEPVGPVAAFTPWNVPIGSPARKMGGALAAGCSIVIKPAEETPGSACAFVQCLMEAGVPPGVVTVLFGDPAMISSALIASPVIRMITLTGSVRVGRALAQQAGQLLKPVILELGGHAPVLIDSGIDAEQVGRQAAIAKMRMGGQICAAPTRFIVHKDVYQAFTSAFVERVKSLRVRDGFDPEAELGPLATESRVTDVHALVEDARSNGAHVAAGGHRIGERGFFYAPTVLTDVPPDIRAMREEPFGPLALCLSVDSLDEGISIANSVTLGLAGYGFTNSFMNADRMARELQCGVVSINNFGSSGPTAPFGGVKDSGLGREGGPDSLEPYLTVKTVLQTTSTV